MEAALRRLRDRPDLEGLSTNPDRVARRGRVIEIVEAAFADWDAEPLLARLAEIGVPAGKVRDLHEVYAWEQTASQGLLVDVEHDTLGPITLPGPPLRFFARGRDGGHPPRARRAAGPGRRRGGHPVLAGRETPTAKR